MSGNLSYDFTTSEFIGDEPQEQDFIGDEPQEQDFIIIADDTNETNITESKILAEYFGGAVEQTNEPTKQTDEQTNEPTKQTDEQTDEPTKQTDEPTKRSDEPTKRSDEPTKRSDEPTKQTDEPTKQPDEPTTQGGKSTAPKLEHVSATPKIENVVKEVVEKVTECNFAHPSGTEEHKLPVCSPTNIVKEMKNFLAAKKPHKYSKATAIESLPAKKIVADMKELLNCNSESCVLKRPEFQQFAKINNLEEILNKFFKPEGPSMDFGLLSNFNIDDVLDQFQTKFAERKFLHIPFQMRDFERVGSELATVDLADKLHTFNTFGVVLNTDTSKGQGIHWFCLFGEKYPNRIELEYFNSSGLSPLPEVQAWLQKTKHYLTKELKLPVTIRYTTGIRFQDDDHSCGVYSIAYIWLRLEGVPPTWFKSENFNDEMMHKLRKNLFRHA